ncbi:MAG: cbb3-type cytochrome c oxidase subunit I, partial [Cyanobacteria bacterium REEB65]|nr:cbb3-type cytochrome c oxidase subunit I [Cyanobacteria bacterium REEB65]
GHVFGNQQWLSGSQFNQMITMHASVMIFLAIIPALTGFGNFIVPLQVGAKDMAFPRLNAIGFWLLPASGIVMFSSFLLGGAAEGGWTEYPPLSGGLFSPGRGVDCWILALHLAGISSILGGLNFIVTILNMRAPGMTLHKMPLFCWTWLTTSWLQVIATPVLAGVLTMLLFDRNFHTSFFRPENGGDPVLWQHLFWFYSHPAVYIQILSAFGIISEVIPTFAKKKIFGYMAIAYSSVAIAFLAFIVWAHHMFATGISATVLSFFMFATMLIAIPTGIKIFSWIATLWGGTIHFKTPLLFAVAFVAFFTIGGLSGIFLASIPVDLQVTDTYFVVAHIHYVLFAGSVLALLAGMYYWLPKISGRMYSEKLGQLHFWITILAMNCTFFPMHFLGLMGMPRRIATYLPEYWGFNRFESISAYFLGGAQLLALCNILWTLRFGQRVGNDPWENPNPTLEWTVSSPPPAHNFDEVPVIL